MMEKPQQAVPKVAFGSHCWKVRGMCRNLRLTAQFKQSHLSHLKEIQKRGGGEKINCISIIVMFFCLHLWNGNHVVKCWNYYD